MRLLLTFLPAGLLLAQSRPAPPIPKYEVKRAENPITVDGKVDDKAWAAASTAQLTFPWESQTGAKQKTVAENRRARFEYFIEDVFEAGIMLTGTEVKSLRFGEGSIAESYAEVRDGQVWLVNANIPEYSHGNRLNHEPKRPRKLLLHAREIDKFVGKASQRGFTLVPLRMYFKNGRAKVELAVAKGKQLHDKRESLKTADAKRDMQRAMSRKE